MEAQMLKDKVAIITGASYGMDQSMAELFAEEGAAVVITARHQEKLEAALDGIRPLCGATVTLAHLANKAGEQPGGAEMLKYSGHFVYFPGPECAPMDQCMPACIWSVKWVGM